MAEKPATKLCKYCKTEIPYDAKVCPNCKKSQKPNGCLIAILVVVVLLVLAAVAGGSSSDSSTAASSTAASTAVQADSAAETQTAEPTPEPTEAPKTTYTVGETAEANDVKVTLVNVEQSTGNQYMTPADGNVYVVLEFEIENNSSTDIGISSMLSFEAYCDDYSVNMDLTANLLYDNKNQLDGNVAAGKKMNGVIGYEVPADFNTLEVKFTPSFWSNHAVTFEIANQ